MAKTKNQAIKTRIHKLMLQYAQACTQNLYGDDAGALYELIGDLRDDLKECEDKIEE